MADNIKRKSGLGRGLSSLFNDSDSGTESIVTWNKDPETNFPSILDRPSVESPVASDTYTVISLELITPGKAQPRRVFSQEEIEELAQSIRVNGVLQPVLVRMIDQKGNVKNKMYELVAGERRWRAAKLAGLTEIPAVIRSMSDLEALQIALIENIQRENLNPIEEAEAYHRLISEASVTQEELSKLVGKSRSHVANMLRLISLPEALKSYVSEGRLTMGHVRALLTIEDPESVGKDVLEKGLSVRETERLVNQIKNRVSGSASASLSREEKLSNVSRETQKPKAKKTSDGEKHPEIQGIEAHLYDLLGLKCKIDVSADGDGCIVMEFKSFKELDQVLSTLMSIDAKD